MVEASLRESTPLLYGTGSAQAQESTATRSAASRSQARRWKIAVSSAALLCAGALVSTKWNAPSLMSLDHVISSSQVSLSKETTKASAEVEEADPVTADFFKTLASFKNPNADPCVDFYEYACGGWLAQNQIPADRPAIDSAFYAVGEENKKIIAKIIDSKPPVISEFYTSCLNSEEVNNEAVAYVANIIDSIHQVNTTAGLLSYAGELDQSYGISSFFSVGVGADPEDPSTNLLQLAQGGLTLPSREYYLEAAKKDAYSALFAKYVADLFAVDGLDKHNVTEYVSAVFETETKFAEISLMNAELRDPWTTNDAFTFTSIEAKYPFLAAYLDGVNKQEPFPKTHAIIATPAFFAAQNDIFQSMDVQTLKQYLSFHVIDSFGPILGEYFRRISHDFHGAVNGAGALSTREKYCVDTTTSYLGAFLGEYYMEEVFGPDAKNSAKELVQEIESSMKKLLKTEEWLDKITYEAAVAKLERVKNYIGGPDEVPDLPFQLSADNFFDNVVSLLQLSASETIQSIGEPVDATKWDMFASTVNAYYDPSANKMVFPAAILQPPFYSADKYPTAANYARIGMVMGHELSHGFDDQGRNYDGNGTLRKWWTASVSDDFTSRAQCLSAQYSSFPIVTEDGVLLGNVNGGLTLGENIADNGGIHLAYQAYKLSQQDESSTVAAPKPKGEDKTDDGGDDKKKGKDVKKDDEGEKAKKFKKEDDEKEEEDDKKSKKDDEKEKKDGKSTSKKSKTEDDEDGKKSKHSKKNADDGEKESEHKKSKKEDEGDDKKSKHKKAKEGDEADKKSEHHKSKKDDEEDEKSEHHKKSKKDDNEEDDKKSKHHKKSKKDDNEDEEDDKKSKHHKKSKKDDNEDEEDDKKSKHVKHRTDEDGDDDKKSKHEWSKKRDDDDKKFHHKKWNEHEENRDDNESKHKTSGEDGDDWKLKYGDDEDSKHHNLRKHPDENRDNKSKKYDSKDNERKHAEHKRYDDGGNEKKMKHKRNENAIDDDNDRHERKHSLMPKWIPNHKRGNGEYYDRRPAAHDEWKPERDEYTHTKKGDGREGWYHHHHHHHRHHHHDDDEWKSGGDEYRHSRLRDGWNGRHRHDDSDHQYRSQERHDWHHDGAYESGDESIEYRHTMNHKRNHHESYDEDEIEYRRRSRRAWGGKERRHEHDDDRSRFENAFAAYATKVVVAANVPRAGNGEAAEIIDDRLFFTAFAQTYCEKRMPAYAELLRTLDLHSPGRWRVNGPLMNFDKFAAAFQCHIGSPMNPEKKCPIW